MATKPFDLAEFLAVCADVLGQPSVDATSNLFDEGGDSLTATHLAVVLEKRWNARLDANDIMSADNFVALHHLVARSAHSANRDPIPAQVSSAAGLPSLNQAIRLELDDDVLTATGTRYPHNIAVGVRSHQPLDLSRVKRACLLLAARHVTLRSTFSAGRVSVTDDTWIGIETIETADVTNATVCAEVDRRIRELIPVETPPWRVLLLGGPRRWQVVVFVMDHLLSDGESMDVLLRDFIAFYEKNDPQLSPIVSYYDWAAWQRTDELPRAVQAARAFVDAENPGGALLPEIRLTVSRDNSAAGWDLTTFTVGTASFRSLSDMAARCSVSAYQALLLAITVALNDLRAPGRFGVIRAVSNRTYPETAEMVGWVANMAYIPLEPNFNDSVATGLARVRRISAAASAMATVPVRALQERLWTGPTPLHRVPSVFVDYRVEGRNPAYTLSGDWQRIDILAPVFPVPGYSLWLTKRPNDVLDVTLGYDRAALTAAAANALVQRLAQTIDLIGTDANWTLSDIERLLDSVPGDDR